MARRRGVLWATGIALALVLGSGLIALGAGAFAEPPVDHAGSFAAISAQLSPSTTSGPAAEPPRTNVRESQTRASVPGEDARDREATTGEPSITPSVTPPVEAPVVPREVESGPSTTLRAGTTTTQASDDEHELPEPEPPEHEPDD